jgi:hypothetical protein
MGFCLLEITGWRRDAKLKVSPTMIWCTLFSKMRPWQPRDVSITLQVCNKCQCQNLSHISMSIVFIICSVYWQCRWINFEPINLTMCWCSLTYRLSEVMDGEEWK